MLSTFQTILYEGLQDRAGGSHCHTRTVAYEPATYFYKGIILITIK